MQAQLDVFRPPPFSAHMAAHNERFTQVPQSARSAKDDSTVVAARLAVVTAAPRVFIICHNGARAAAQQRQPQQLELGKTNVKTKQSRKRKKGGKQN